MEENEVIHKVRIALQQFFDNDHDLLSIGVNERSVSHKLAEYLQTQFSDLKVDCEYNRHLEDIKTMKGLKRMIEEEGPLEADDLDASTVYPDVIVHKRRTDDFNLLVVEMKTRPTDRGEEKDKAKLKLFTGPEFRYQFGLYIALNLNDRRVGRSICFQDGEDVTDERWASLTEIGYGG